MDFEFGEMVQVYNESTEITRSGRFLAENPRYKHRFLVLLENDEGYKFTDSFIYCEKLKSTEEEKPLMRPEYEREFIDRVIAAFNNPCGIDLSCSCKDCCCNDAITYKLNPCPWCGSTRLKFRYDAMRDSTSVQCLNCHSVVSSIDAITTWNTLLRHTGDNNEQTDTRRNI